MNAALNNLTFLISLVDRVSGPMGNITRSIDQASAGFQKGFGKIAYGAAGLVGSVYSLNSLLEPTKEMQKALGEVRSLDVAEASLTKLQETALQFSTQYGGSAVDFVRSSYDIKSAIDSLTGDELPAFTRAGAILAKSSKAQVSDMTNYMGTMYSIFQETADKMGKTAWIEQMTGQTALAVKIFKAEGKDVSDFFTRIGATATAARRPLEEQMAVFGQLKATMPGAEAGTVYASFLKNVVQAQDILGPLTDSHKKMLPMVDILEKIKNKYGDFIDINEGGDLGGKHGFGSQEAVKLINLLLPKMDQLRQNTALLGQVKGMDDAMKMAKTVADADPWGKMKAGVDAISISIGTKLLPVLLPVFESVNAILQKFLAWTNANPILAKNLGQIALTLIGVTAAASAFSLFSGLATVSSTAWTLALNFTIKPLWLLAKSIWGALPAIWSFTAAILANPITWWVLGITALVAGVALAIVYWKQWTPIVIDFASRFLEMIGVFALVDNALAAWEGLKNWWAGFKVWLAGLNPFGGIIAGLNNIIGMANKIPGVNISPIGLGGQVSTAPKASPTGGGIIKQMSSVMNANKSSSIGDVHVHNYNQPMSGAKLLDEMLFAGG